MARVSDVPAWRCLKCGNLNFPYGHTDHTFPITEPQDVKCERCGHVDKGVVWYDDETKKLMVRKELGLIEGSQTNIAKVEKEIEVLKESRNADRKELELLRQLVDDLTQNKLKQVRDEASEQGEDLASLMARVKAIEDWKDFTEKEK